MDELRFFCGPILLSDWSVVKALARRVAELHCKLLTYLTPLKTIGHWTLDPDGAFGAACLALFPADTHTGAGGKQEQLQAELPALVRCR